MPPSPPPPAIGVRFQYDGDEFEIQAGDVYEVQPGHDAWVVGNDNFVGLEFEGKTAEEFSKK